MNYLYPVSPLPKSAHRQAASVQCGTDATVCSRTTLADALLETLFALPIEPYLSAHILMQMPTKNLNKNAEEIRAG